MLHLEGAVPDPGTGWRAAQQKGTCGCSWAAGSAQASSVPWQLRRQPAFCITPSIASCSKQVILLLCSDIMVVEGPREGQALQT